MLRPYALWKAAAWGADSLSFSVALLYKSRLRTRPKRNNRANARLTTDARLAAKEDGDSDESPFPFFCFGSR